MKKRNWATCLASLLCVSAGLGLAACGNGNQNTDNPPVVEEKPDENAPAHASADATLTLTGSIDKTTARKQISADLFGLFLEDINYASQALDDNMIANGSFENSEKEGKSVRWRVSNGTSLTVFAEDGVLKSKPEFGDTNPDYAELTLPANGYVDNLGFAAAPVAVKAGVEYVFSAFLKTGSYAGVLKAEVTDGTKTYAETELSLSASNEWVKYQSTFKATETASQNLFVRLTFGSAGKVLLDCAKLETADSTIGIKNYLYNAIKDLSPAFFRFPGGCIIEGVDDRSAYDWKNSIGAVKGATSDTVPAFTYTLNDDGAVSEVTTYGEQATRTYNTDIWYRNGLSGGSYYQMEYGIGFYEYFLLCESLGAKAIPIVSCGMSCQTQSNGTALKGRHGKGVADFIQDAKDLIAFAKGSVNSSDANEKYWAQVRTNMGHPEPFDMDYIGIGNEQWGDYFARYYEKFLDDFMLEENPLYRSVTPIVGNCTMFDHCELPVSNRKGVAQTAAESYLRKSNSMITSVSEYGVHDQHYYMNYTDFLANAYLYDDYKRPDTDPDTYYDVFVGEYSANSTAVRSPSANDRYLFQYKENSWITALSEAAMMTGFERNGDIVKLAAYAPMFGNLIDPGDAKAKMHWSVNMMFFNNTDVILTPNYYVQQLFMQNAGDHKVDARMTFASGEPYKTTYKATGGADRELDDVYFVVSADEETKDVIVKVVNAGANEIKLNIDVQMTGVTLGGTAKRTVLQGFTKDDVNTLQESAVLPYSNILGGFTDGNKIGVTLGSYSVTALRIRTK